MDVKTWTNKIVGQISESMCLDCADDAARLRNEDVFKEELEWAYYLGVPSVFGPELSKGSNSNYAGIVSAFISRKFNSPYWIPVDIQCEGESDTAAWKRWSEFHYQLDFCPGVQPCLRFTSATPSPEVISLWKGEPVDMILIPTSLFTWEEAGDIAHLPSH